ncbi:CHAD domain-containing protein [bacterium]|nr:CHAD domain-containing protein [bacterium]
MPATPIPDLHAEMPAALAVRALLLELLGQMRHRIPAVLEDHDPEELHQFRIAIRKSRVVLSLLGDLIGKKQANRNRKRLSLLGRSTNRLRDLDVFLQDQSTLSEVLPVGMRDGLDPYFERVRTERCQLFDQFASWLVTDEVTDLLDEWDHFLTGLAEGDDHPKASFQPIAPIARSRILHHYDLVEAAIDLIDTSSPPYQLHEVRIEIKKLRYLIEFFHPLYPGKAMGRFVKRLKRFQEHLGRYNDCAMQHEFLQAGLQERFGVETEIVRDIEPLKLLIESVRQRAQQEREAFTRLIEDGRSSGLMQQLRTALELSIER